MNDTRAKKIALISGKYLKRLTGNSCTKEELEDCAQDVLIECIGTYKNNIRWLVIDHLRRVYGRTNRYEKQNKIQWNNGRVGLEDYKPIDAGFESRINAKLDARRILYGVGLIQIERKVIVMLSEGMRSKEIANELGKSESRIHQIKKSAFTKIQLAYQVEP